MTIGNSGSSSWQLGWWLSSSWSWLLSWCKVPHPQTMILSEGTGDFATIHERDPLATNDTIYTIMDHTSHIDTLWSPLNIYLTVTNHHNPRDALRDPFQNWLLDKHHNPPIANPRENHPKLKMVRIFITTKRGTQNYMSHYLHPRKLTWNSKTSGLDWCFSFSKGVFSSAKCISNLPEFRPTFQHPLGLPDHHQAHNGLRQVAM